MPHTVTVLFTLLAYKIALLAIGLWYRSRTHDGLDFFLAGRKLGPFVAAISASASSSSAWTLLGVSGAAYAWGLSAVWLLPSCVGGFVLNWTLLAPALQRVSREQNAWTVTEVLAGPAGGKLRAAVSNLASLIILVSLGAYVSSQFQAAGKTFSETFGLPVAGSIVLGAGVVVLYTLLGGFWAVSVTDTLQGLVMAATATLLPLAALAAVGGPAAFAAALADVPQQDFLSLTRGLPPAAGVGFVLGLLGIGLGYPGQPHVVNRFMALEAGADSLRRARRVALGWACVVYAGMLMVGWCGRILVPELSDPEVVFISLTGSLFPPVLSGIMLAAVLSAIMSTADSQLLVASSAICHDLDLGSSTDRPRSGSPSPSPSQSQSLLTRSRQVTLALSAGAILAALFGSQEIFSQVLFAWSAMGSAFGPLLLVTVLRRRVPAASALQSMLAGFVLSVASYYIFAGEPYSGAMERVLPFAIAGVLALAGLRTRTGFPESRPSA